MHTDIKESNSEELMKAAVSSKRVFIIWVLWIMAFYHYCIITGFSAQPAAESSKESGMVVGKILDMLAAISNISQENAVFINAEFIIRKLAHFTNFFILGFLYIMLADASSEGKRLFGAVSAALVCGLAGAALDELHQLFVPGRSAEVRDVCIDFAGVFTGCLVYTVMKVICYGKKK